MFFYYYADILTFTCLRNHRKISLILTPALLIILISTAISCGSFNTAPEPWEGISGNILKVTISEFFPFEENVSSDIIKNQIKERLNQRASLIIASHLSVNLPRNKISPETDIALNKLINDSINNGNIEQFNCSENNYCTAQSVYDISELQAALELIIKK